MISFNCPCKTHSFSLPESEAGGLIQCPKCGRLNDVPSLSDLESLDADGTLKLEPTAKRKKTTVKELHRAYSNETTDDSGNEVDLRQSIDDLRSVGSKERSNAGKLKVEKPRYDPLTGELLRPLDVKPSTPKPAKPLTPAAVGSSPAADAADRRRRAEAYNRLADDLQPIPTLTTLPLRLLEPLNMLMIGFMCAGLVIFALLSIPVLAGLIFVAPIPLIVGGLLLAHYANCIDDFGPGQENDIPKFLRNAEFSADMWKPFVRMAFSLGVCFVPALIFGLRTNGAIQFIGSGLLLAMGAVMFPAVALVFCASQHVGNLRPDRLLGTIVVLGGQYVPTLIFALVAVILHFVGAATLLFAVFALIIPGDQQIVVPLVGQMPKGILWITAVLGIFLSVYFGHLAAWWLGVIYRRNEGRFPWVFEMHERARIEHKRLKVLAELEKNRQRTGT